MTCTRIQLYIDTGSRLCGLDGVSKLNIGLPSETVIVSTIRSLDVLVQLLYSLSDT